ncbi:MAG: hypothetical protein M1426_05645 [Patescibacteria group bacterium]|nr:hypothetical protein [Patescibacteria group bacterium]
MEQVNKNSGVGVLVSGGVDSCVLIDDCTQNYNEVVPIYVKTGLFILIIIPALEFLSVVE